MERMPGGRPRGKAQVDSVKSVTKVLDILEHLGSAQRAVSVSELARMTGLNVSTAFRLLQTLMARGYVEQQRSNRGYLLGPRIFQMGSAYLQGSDLAAIARPHLEALRDEVGETA
jgi:IclR family transcriptional regulator, KDG regulon repressor